MGLNWFTELIFFNHITRQRLSSEELNEVLEHLLESAGNPNLMTQNLKQTVCEHPMGNYRALCIMSGELLATGALKERSQLDEQLYFECFAQPKTPNKRKSA